MLRKLTRTLCLLDDVLEVVVWFVGRSMARHPLTTALLVLSVAGGAYWVSLPPAPVAPPPAPAVAVAPVPDLDPVAEAEMERMFAGMMDPVDFSVVRTFNHHGERHKATVLFRGSRLEVSPGSLLPSVGEPELVVTEIGCNVVTALDVANRELIHRTKPVPKNTPCVRTRTFRVNAIAGDAPDFVAVIEYLGQTYVVGKGTTVPEDGQQTGINSNVCGFRVEEITSSTVRAVDLRTGTRMIQNLVVDEDLDDPVFESPAPARKPTNTQTPVKSDDIDLDGI